MLSSVFLFLNIGTGEMVLILFAALMLFGGNKLPELARGLGKGIRDFKDASEDVKREINNQINNYDDKKTEAKKIEEAPVEEQELEVTSTAPIGSIPAYEGHTATDAIEDETEFKNPEAPETYDSEPTELSHPVTGNRSSSIDLEKSTDAPAKSTIKEEY